ncbi:hypothetical protein WMO28_04870 [Blautia sp. CLA-JM-H16]|uniref:Uncharacterized protein n=1 Tax=Blautia aquisgranensis TaxID=3133153 RepID=A0ABV1BED0_9FIRM
MTGNITISNYNALSYVNKALDSEKSSENNKKTVAALYLYWSIYTGKLRKNTLLKKLSFRRQRVFQINKENHIKGISAYEKE